MAKRIGVFICHCGENIASKVDVEQLRKYAENLDNVVVSKTHKYICSEGGANEIKETIKKYKLNGLVCFLFTTDA